MENSSLKSILKRIKKCWLKYPDSYQKREKDEIFYGYHWEEYDMVLHENYISFVGDTDRRLVLLINCRV